MLDEQAIRTDRAPAARVAAVAAGVLFGAVAALHVLWAAGSIWPFSDKVALAKIVWGGPPSTFPSPAATIAAAALIGSAALVVTGCGGLWGARVPARVFSAATWMVATVLFLRALLFGLGSIGSDAVNAAWEQALFSPLSLVLAVLCAVVARLSSRSRSSVVGAAT